MRKFILKKTSGGYALLLGVLILAAVGIAVTQSLLLSGISASKTSIALHHSIQAKAYLLACNEEALEQIRADNSYTGTQNLTFVDGSCAYTVSLGTEAEERSIATSSSVGNINRSTQITISSLSPIIKIVAWEDVY